MSLLACVILFTGGRGGLPPEGWVDPSPKIHGILRDTVNKRTVRILLQCFLVRRNFFLVVCRTQCKNHLIIFAGADALHSESSCRSSELREELAIKTDENANAKNLNEVNRNQGDIKKSEVDTNKNKTTNETISENDAPTVGNSQSLESFHEGSHIAPHRDPFTSSKRDAKKVTRSDQYSLYQNLFSIDANDRKFFHRRNLLDITE